MNYHIIGCGGIGSILSIELSKFLTKQDRIHLYDYDIITKKEFYFKECDIGEYKIDIIKSIIKSKNPDIYVFKKKEKINFFKRLNKQKHLVLDCRDNKTYLSKVKSDIRISFDNMFLFLDSRLNINKREKSFYEYGFPKKIYEFKLIIYFIINFIFAKYYENHELYIFNFKNIIEKGKVNFEKYDFRQ